MNLDELQTARDRERQTDKLQQLRESFYQDAAEFIQQLRRERDRAAERADDPFDSPEVSQLSDEISTAETTVEAIYEKRIGKLVKAASFDAAGLPSEADGMTTEEQDLFTDLVSDIKQNRTRVMSILDGQSPDTAQSPVSSDETPASAAGETEPPTTETDLEAQEPATAATTDPAAQTEGPADSGVSAADVMGSGPAEESQTSSRPVPPDVHEPLPDEIKTGDETATEVSETPATDGGSVSTATSEAGIDSPHTDSSGTIPDAKVDSTTESESELPERETVLITDDVDTFVGFDDRDYDLAANDVVTLPAQNAAVLIERDVAREL